VAIATGARAGSIDRIVIRDALQQASHEGRAPSRHDLLAYICSTVDGPEDLSTNPKYVAGYGE